MHTKRSPIQILGIIVALILFVVIARDWYLYVERSTPQPPPPKVHGVVFDPIMQTQMRLSAPEYQYSVLPGGVGSVRDFNARVSADPALHDLACVSARPTVLPADLVVFTTFRKDGKIKWNRRPILVHKGEHAITGCSKTFLMRCGNQISLTPQEPSESLTPGTLEIPLPRYHPPVILEPSPEIPPLPGGPVLTTENFSPTAGPISLGGGGFGGGSVPLPGGSGPKAVDEPATIQLVLFGLAALALGVVLSEIVKLIRRRS